MPPRGSCPVDRNGPNPLPCRSSEQGPAALSPRFNMLSGDAVGAFGRGRYALNVRDGFGRCCGRMVRVALFPLLLVQLSILPLLGVDGFFLHMRSARAREIKDMLRKDDKHRVLSIDGGGIRGALSAGEHGADPPSDDLCAHARNLHSCTTADRIIATPVLLLRRPGAVGLLRCGRWYVHGTCCMRRAGDAS